MSDGSTPGQGGFGPPEPTQPNGGAGAPGYGYPSPVSPQGGYGYPAVGAGGTPPPPQGPPPAAQMPGQAGYGRPLVSIGDITVTEQGIVTPAGQLPLKGAVWTVTDMSRTEEKIPTVAVVLAIVLTIFTCLLSLLFLLMKEKVTTGYVQVTVNSGGKFHSTMVPVQHPGVVMQVTDQVNYARSLAS